MAQRDCQGISLISIQLPTQPRQQFDHVLDLDLLRMALPGHSTFHRRGRVFMYRQGARQCRREGGAPSLPQLQRRGNALVHKHLFHSDVLWIVGSNHFSDSVVDLLESMCKFVAARADTTACDVVRFLPVAFNHPETGDARSWVDAKNADERRAQWTVSVGVLKTSGKRCQRFFRNVSV